MNNCGNNDMKVRILLAARKLFANQGYDGTTVRQICEEAGANVALVSYYFGGKENMFAALFENFFPNEQIASIGPDVEPVEGIRILIKEVTEYRMREPELIRIMQQEIILNTPRIQKIREHAMPIWQLLRKWLEAGRKQGVFEFGSTDTVFMSIVGALLFYRHSDYWRALTEVETDMDGLIAELTRFILNGLQYKSN
ncbi:TetR family transcriptional regulator [Paenibacillus radicis (ex Gao et al. 2016)]|uniref:TetR family transcriptional regulator n=1 Tax=Paenibacillus radicis (ex Gao et al. 2016) TaxID=1737354 RepID=A0A917M7C6_9BACL|nr:TetR family transcriptional regulator [Paenibacillus radicis (ex Gao et al. 2016)]GGG82196.1 TetR family transcriptional regulator [Paenibacillus radicis (ex Gao et al. 2016)]